MKGTIAWQETSTRVQLRERPSLPFTLAGYHGQQWLFSEVLLNKLWVQTLRPPVESVTVITGFINVKLGTGKVIRKKLRQAQFKLAKPPESAQARETTS